MGTAIVPLNSHHLGAMTFQERLQKGSLGEIIVINHLKEKGYLVYTHPKQAHPVDMVCFDDNYRMFFVEVKTKPKLNSYNGTGIDYRHFEIYKQLRDSYNTELYIYFVDFSVGSIYGNEINTLIKPVVSFENDEIVRYPFTVGRGRNKVIIFSLENMVEIGRIS